MAVIKYYDVINILAMMSYLYGCDVIKCSWSISLEA